MADKTFLVSNKQHVEWITKVPFIKPDGCEKFKIRARVGEPCMIFVWFSDRIVYQMLEYDEEKNVLFVDGKIVAINRRG